jgi:uncharacterized protein YeeX (DUF496 family)
MIGKRFISNYNFYSSVKSNYMPYLRFAFYDNPYLLKDKNQYDMYTARIPVHIYCRDKDGKVNIYSMLNSWVDYNNNKEEVYGEPREFLDKVRHLVDNYTINNHNISLLKSSLSFELDKFSTISKNLLPIYIFPEQKRHRQYMVNKGIYDIKTLLIPSRDGNRISQVWNKVGEFYDYQN